MVAISPNRFEFVVERSLDSFNETINKKLKEGWCLLGPANHTTGTASSSSQHASTHSIQEYHSATLVMY